MCFGDANFLTNNLAVACQMVCISFLGSFRADLLVTACFVLQLLGVVLVLSCVTDQVGPADCRTILYTLAYLLACLLTFQ